MNSINEIPFDDIGPEKIFLFRDSLINMRGFVVIDSSLTGITMGGVRIAPDITLNEIIRSARTMTLKGSIYKIPIGGAWAGIVSDPSMENKELLIQSFTESIKTLIREDLFYPEPGLGTIDKDIEIILKLSGNPKLMPRRIGIFKYDIPLKKNYIGLGAYYCLLTSYQNLNRYNIGNTPIEWNEPPTVLLEGFGRAGSELAMHLKEGGFKLLGISTIEGAIFDEDGLDIDKLLELKKKYGDDLVNHYESENLEKPPKEELFNLSGEYPVDFIIPGARPDAINSKNIDKIEPRAIVPISNNPYEKGILSTLYEKKILAVPDFISNAGDILAFSSRRKSQSNVFVNEYIEDKMKKKTIEILKHSYENDTPSSAYAKELALERITKKMNRRKEHFESCLKDKSCNPLYYSP
jgi:glutamate dehydrogenase (NAD(P)+)